MTDHANTIALYTTFPQEFLNKMQDKGGKYRSPLWCEMNIAVALLNYAYKRYFGVDVKPDELNVHTFPRLKEYGGLYFSYTLGSNSIAIAIGKEPLAIGAMSRSLDDERTPDTELLHTNELAEYEKSGRSPDALCEIWSKKIAYRKLHCIEKPIDCDPFDNSFQKEIDGTLGTYSLRRFDYGNYANFLAVTGKAEFVEIEVENIL